MQNLSYNYSKVMRLILWTFFSLYILFIIRVLFLSTYRLATSDQESNYNLIPFYGIRDYVVNFSSYNFDTWIFNTFGNVIIFIPLGFCLPFLFKYLQKLKHIIILSFVFSMVIEILQYMTHLGQFDVDDIILNIVGSMIGFVFFLLTKKVFLLKIKKGAVPKALKNKSR